MRRITAEEIEKINEINGTLNDRYEYFEKLTEILNGKGTYIRWNKNSVKEVMLDDETILTIACKTVKGKMMLSRISADTHKRTEEHPWGQFQLFELKKGALVKTAEM